MSKSSRPGPLGIRLSTYADLEKIVHGFARGDLNFLILLGGHGLGKSRALRQAMAGQACWLEGNASDFGLYCQLWRLQNRPVVHRIGKIIAKAAQKYGFVVWEVTLCRGGRRG